MRLNPASRTPLGKFATDNMSFVRRGKQKAGSVVSAKDDGQPGFVRQMIHKPAVLYPSGGRSGMAAIGVEKAESRAPQAMPSQVRPVQKPSKGRERQGAFNKPPRKIGVETPPPFGPIASIDPDVVKTKVGWTDEARAAAAAARSGRGVRGLSRMEAARSAGTDAGNRSMRVAGRTRWSKEDYQAAAAEMNRVLGGSVKPAHGAGPLRPGEESGIVFGGKAWSDEARAAALAARRVMGPRKLEERDVDKIREAALRAHAGKLRREGNLDHHSYRIAADTLRMPKPIANVMGGPSQDGARMMADQLLAGKFARGRVIPESIGKAAQAVPNGFVPGRNPTSGIGVGASMDVQRGSYPGKRPFGQSFGTPIPPTASENTARTFDGIWDAAKVKTRGPIGRGTL
jgi:hypothetical protein